MPGIYAWYFSPRQLDVQDLPQAVAALSLSANQITTSVRLDYGTQLVGSGYSKAVYGSAQENVQDVIAGVVESSGALVAEAFCSILAPLFTRPIYIGMASSLYDRLYDNHYKELSGYWEPGNAINEFLLVCETSSHSDMVMHVMDKLGLGHSFALEARVRGFRPSALIVVFTLFDEDASLALLRERVDGRKHRRQLERALQIISLPTCGKI